MARVSKKELEFRSSLQKLFNSHEGHIVLKNLQERYIDASSFTPNSDETIYNLGQKELVQYLISQLKDVEVLNNIKLSGHLFE